MRVSPTTMFVLIILCLCCYTKSIRLGKQEESVLKETLREFESVPENGPYDNVIEMPHTASKLIQKIFIWCPIRNSGLTIECPVHNCPLKIGMWTDVLYGLRTDPRNPRLIMIKTAISFWCERQMKYCSFYHPAYREDFQLLCGSGVDSLCICMTMLYPESIKAKISWNCQRELRE